MIIINLTTWRKKYNVPTNKHLYNKLVEYSDSQRWYINSYVYIHNLVVFLRQKHYLPKSHYDTDAFIKLLAATSPRQSVKRNLETTIQIFVTYKKGGDVTKVSCGIANKAIHKNVNRVIRGQNIIGAKVKPFAEALNGNTKAVVIDSWMLKCFNIPRSSPTPNDRVHIVAIINKLAAWSGLAPAAVQACLWSYAKTELNDTPFKEDSDFSTYIKQYMEENKYDNNA